jgi:RNA polymerase sigma-32 factor
MSTATLAPSLAGENGLNRYLAEIRTFPVLSFTEEQHLAKQWRDAQDTKAAHRLVTSHLRLVAKIAMGYRGYGLPVSDLIAEGNLGLMHSVKKFDPDKGFRLATYAMWWIKASIQEYILHSWSLVKMGTTAAQKKLFFNLRRLKNRLDAADGTDLTPAQTQRIADSLDVTPVEVTDMNRRLSGGDQSLNAPLKASEEGSGEWQDILEDERDNQETRYLQLDETRKRRSILRAAMATLKPREKEIFAARKLLDEPHTLEVLADKYGISRERIRQIETRAMEKITAHIKSSPLLIAAVV